MDAKLRALNADDYRAIGSYVKTTSVQRDSYESMSDCLDSKYLFGEHSDSSAVHTVMRAHKRAVIELVVPTFNYVLATSSAGLLGKMLGIQKDLWESIVKITVAYDPENDEYVEIRNASADVNYLYGAQIAEYLIDKLDVDEAIVESMYESLNGLTRKSQAHKVFNINKKQSDCALPCGYYLHIIPGNEDKLSRKAHAGENLQELVAQYLFPNANTRLSYLINMPHDKSALYGMLNYRIMVVPSEMRPEVMKKIHKLTARYATVIKANTEMQMLLTENYKPVDMQTHYLALDKATSRLQYKCRDDNSRRSNTDLDDLSITERIKSKQGQIRMYNLGKRQDYSARAVVTINPYLPLDYVNIPKAIIPKIYEYQALRPLVEKIEQAENSEDVSNVYEKLNLAHLDRPEAQAELFKIIKENKILENVPLYMGRQPTLHKQSLQGFYAGVSNSNAAEVNPLVCPAFNMDFDGDQAHFEVPMSYEAAEEVKNLLLTTKNIYLAKTGECTIVPRQDMIYGLYIATRSTYQLGEVTQSFESLAELRKAVIRHKVKVWDTVSAGKYPRLLAGQGAVMASFPDDMLIPFGCVPGPNQMEVIEVTSKTISKYMDLLLRTNVNGDLVIPMGTGYDTVNTFVGAINHIVELGFRIARIYSPSMSMLAINNEVPEYDNAISHLRESMKDIDYLYSIGLETQDNYSVEFDNKLEELSNTIDKTIHAKLGEDNGYSLLAKSGARGNTSNLKQIFAYKGRVKKNESESFDALIEHSYWTQLKPFESFIAAYGGRQGQIDKSLNTGKTGYVSRLMWHTCQGISVKMEDCGTTEGFKVSKGFLATMCEGDASKCEEEIKSMFKHTITGRYDTDGNFIDEFRAEQLADDPNTDYVTIRSPLKCRCGVCKKCYGVDWSTHKPALIGLNAGLIAAQSIGEPGTQLTMKSFQKGGVAGKADLTSAFTKVESYIKCINIAQKSKAGAYSGYDPIAWCTGKVKETKSSDITKKYLTIEPGPGATDKDYENANIKIEVPANLQVKSDVKRGEGLSFVHGDYYIREILEYCGIEEAQRYLIYKLYNLYKSECCIVPIHFEVLVASMTRYMIVTTDRKDLRVGQYATYQELFSGDASGTTFYADILSVNTLNKISNNALDSIVLENHVAGLSRACLLQLTDDLTRPINRMLLGLPICNGSAIPGFMEERQKGF